MNDDDKRRKHYKAIERLLQVLLATESCKPKDACAASVAREIADMEAGMKKSGIRRAWKFAALVRAKLRRACSYLTEGCWGGKK